MSSVDDRIVNMQFNNKQFTQGAAESEKALTGVERMLARVGKGRGLDNLGASAEATRTKFSALQVAGVTALATITNQAVHAGTNFVKSFSGMNGVMDGFQEYELKMGSLQTIMANTGAPLQKVNKYLNELNTYSDKTIYNFADMTRSIGLFTNAGIGLKPATAMIKGFSNEAAVSGTNAAQAAGAAYQLSQALNAGVIRLMDWRSLQNVNMGNKNMQKSLIEIAQAMGKFSGQAEVATQAQTDFNGSLEKKWLTADVMENYLKIMAEGNRKLNREQMKQMGLDQQQIKTMLKRQRVAENAATKVRTWTQLLDTTREQIGSGWAASMEIILGDFNEATKLFTKASDFIGNIIQAQSKSRNEMLQAWADGGGRTMLFDSIGRIATSLQGIFRAVGDAWRDIFPKGDGNLLLTITKGFDRLTQTLAPSEETISNIGSVFRAVFSILGAGWSVVRSIGSVFSGFFSALSGSSEGASLGILGLVGGIADAITAFMKMVSVGGKISDFLFKLGATAGNAVRPLIEAVSGLGDVFGGLASGGIDSAQTALDRVKKSLADFASLILGGLAFVTQPLAPVSEFFEDLREKVDAFRDSFGSVTNTVKTFTGAVSGLGVPDAFERTPGKIEEMGLSFDGLRKVTDKAKSSATDMYRTLSGAGSDAATAAAEGLSEAQLQSSIRMEQAKDVAEKVGQGLKRVFEFVGDAAGWLKKQFSDLFGDMGALEWGAMLNTVLSGGILLAVRSFMKTLENIAQGFGGLGSSITGVFDQLTGTLKTMQTGVKVEIVRNIAIAVGILTASIIALSFIDPAKIGVSLGAIATVMGVMVTAIGALVKVSAGMEKAGIGLVAIGGAMMLMASAIIQLAIAVNILGRLNLKTLGKGLGAIAIGLGLLVGAVFAMSKMENGLERGAASMLIMAFALNVLATAVLAFGKMKLETLAKGLGSVAIALGIFSVALNKTKIGGKNALAIAGSIAIISGAMLMLSAAVLAFGKMNLGTLAKGFGAITVSLILFSAALIALSVVGPNILAAGGAMVLMAGALNMLVPVILTLGTLPWEVVARGIGFVAAALAVLLIGAAVAAIPPVTAGLIVLGGVIGVLGVSMGLAGAGMAAFAAGFAIVVATGSAGVAVLTAAFSAFISMLPTIGAQMAAAFVAFLDVMAKASPKIRRSLGEILRNMLGVVRDNVGPFKDTVIELIQAGVDAVVEAVPIFVEGAAKLIRGFLQKFTEHIPGLARDATKFVVAIMNAIGDNTEEVAKAALQMITDFIGGIATAIDEKGEDLRTEGARLAYHLADGMSGGLMGYGVKKVTTAFGSLVSQGLSAARRVGLIKSPSKATHQIGVYLAQGMANGISARTKRVVNAAARMANLVIAEGSAAVLKVQKLAAKQQDLANAMQARANIAERNAKRSQRVANQLQRQADKAKADSKEQKRLQKEADKAQKAADKLANISDRKQSAADRRQTRADAAAERVLRAKAFQDADLMGKGEMRDEKAVELSARAKAMLARANANAAEIKRLAKSQDAADKKAAAALRKENKKVIKNAREVANEAKKAHREAQRYYVKAINDSVKSVGQDLRDFDQARKDDAELEAADTANKAAILDKRAAANEKKAADARKAGEKALAEANRLAKTDPKAAQKQVELAEQQFAIYKEATQLADQQRDQAKRYREQLKSEAESGAGGAGGGVVITPSKTVLEEAAKVIDRYTASLQQAQEAAAAAQPTVQFIQTNHSPEALTAAEIYRQTRNLLSTQEIKMGAQ